MLFSHPISRKANWMWSIPKPLAMCAAQTCIPPLNTNGIPTSFRWKSSGIGSHWNSAPGSNRSHLSVEAYRTEDANVCIIGIGSSAGTIRLAVDRLREEGLKIGSVRIGLMRPFPVEGVKKAIGSARHLIVIDRDVSFGAEGIVAQEVKAGLFDHDGVLKTDRLYRGHRRERYLDRDHHSPGAAGDLWERSLGRSRDDALGQRCCHE